METTAEKFPCQYPPAARLLENPWFSTGLLPFDLISEIHALPSYRTSLTPLENVVRAGWGIEALGAYWEDGSPTHEKFIEWAHVRLQP
jgi:hypothetical protein